MTTRLSTGLQNFLASGGGIADALNNGVIEIYSGAQPASADAAPSGTLLNTITDSSLAHTSEVLSSGTVTLSGSAGSVNTVTVNSIDILGGAVPFNGTLAQTAADVAAQINRNISSPNYTATSAGAVVTIKAMPNSGTGPNTFAVSATLTTLTAAYVDMSGGVAAANGLKFSAAAAGVLTPKVGQTWSGNNVNTSTLTAGWFRWYPASGPDAHALDATGTLLRMDGSVGTAGAELNLPNTSFAPGAPTVISGGTVTVPNQ